MKIIYRPSPAQAIAEANRRWTEHLNNELRKAVAPDLARLVAALPRKDTK